MEVDQWWRKINSSPKAIIKQVAIEKGLIPDVPMKLGTQYPDFKKAGLIIKSDELPRKCGWQVTNNNLNGQMPGKMELVPFGIHNSIFHKGGRSEGHWSYRSKGR